MTLKSIVYRPTMCQVFKWELYGINNQDLVLCNLTLFGPISWHQLMFFNRSIAQIIVSFQIMLVIIVLFTILATTIGQHTALTEAFLKSQLYYDLRDTPIYNERGLESRCQINTAAFGTNVGDLWL